MRGRARGEDGFALLAALWILVGLSVLAMAVALAGRDSVAAARNRAALTRARWQAVDCLERSRATIADALAAEGPDVMEAASAAWRTADRRVAASALVHRDCRVGVHAAGARADVNTADVPSLARVFRAAGLSPSTADSIADAIADWRDPDDHPRPFGAEREWYEARGMWPPRNGPFADVREIARVRGWGAAPGLDTLTGVDSARVPLLHAPEAVLASLPGFGPEARARLMEMRMRGDGAPDLAAFARSLSPGAARALEASFVSLASGVAWVPDAWIMTARATEGAPPLTAAVELTLVRTGRRTAVVRRRTWSE